MRIARAVLSSVLGRATYPDMPRVDASEGASRSCRGAEDGVERGVGGAVIAAEGIAPKVGVLVHPCGHKWMCDL